MGGPYEPNMRTHLHSHTQIAAALLLPLAVAAAAITATALPPRDFYGPTCRHKPHGCCRHNLTVMRLAPDGPCDADCALRKYQCQKATPGGSVGIVCRPE